MKGNQNREIITTRVLNLSAFLSREHNLTNVQFCSPAQNGYRHRLSNMAVKLQAS
jgi:hypothetical protein